MEEGCLSREVFHAAVPKGASQQSDHSNPRRMHIHGSKVDHLGEESMDWRSISTMLLVRLSPFLSPSLLNYLAEKQEYFQ